VTATTMVGAVLTNAVAGGVQYLATQAVDQKPVNALDLTASVAIGGIAGRVIGPLKSSNPLPPDLTSQWLMPRWGAVAKSIVNEDLTKAALTAPSVVRSAAGGLTSNAPVTKLTQQSQSRPASQNKSARSSPVKPRRQAYRRMAQ
jgi:hypothetical protein